MKKAAKVLFMGVGLVVVGIIALVVVLSFAFGGDDSASEPKKVESGTEQSVAADTTEEATEEEEAPSTFAVGDTVDLDGLEITISSAKYVSPSQYSPPAAGKVLQMDIAVTNNTDAKVFFDSMEFNMYDPEGNALETYIYLDPMDISGEIHPGKKLSGVITYDVPEAANFELIYEPMFSWTEKQITWNIVPQ